MIRLSIRHDNKHIRLVTAHSTCTAEQLTIGQFNSNISPCVSRGILDTLYQLGHGIWRLMLDVRKPHWNLRTGMVRDDTDAGTMGRDLQFVHQWYDKILRLIKVFGTNWTRAIHNHTNVQRTLTGRRHPWSLRKQKDRVKLKAEAGGKWLFFVTNYVYPLCSAYYLGMISLSESKFWNWILQYSKGKEEMVFLDFLFFDLAADTRWVFKYTSKLMLAT